MTSYSLLRALTVAMHVCGMWTVPSWVPSDSSLSHVANAKAAQLGQKLSMGLEAAYQVYREYYLSRSAAWISSLKGCQNLDGRVFDFLDIHVRVR